MAIMSVIRACNGQRQDEFKASLGYIENKKLAQARLCLNKTRLWETPTGFLLKMGPRGGRGRASCCALLFPPSLSTAAHSFYPLAPWPMRKKTLMYKPGTEPPTRARGPRGCRLPMGMRLMGGTSLQPGASLSLFEKHSWHLAAKALPKGRRVGVTV